MYRFINLIKKAMNTKTFIVGIVIFTVVVLLGSYFLLVKTPSPEVKVASYNTSSKDKPKVEVKKTFFDMGKMKVSEQKTAEFTLKNIGNKPLQLFDISSSCGCTVGQISYQGKDSKEFGMHSVGSFETPIAPNTEAKVKVTYRPYVMPVYGQVERQVFISTNDPANPKLSFQVKAFVK